MSTELLAVEERNCVTSETLDPKLLDGLVNDCSSNLPVTQENLAQFCTCQQNQPLLKDANQAASNLRDRLNLEANSRAVERQIKAMIEAFAFNVNFLVNDKRNKALMLHRYSTEDDMKTLSLRFKQYADAVAKDNIPLTEAFLRIAKNVEQIRPQSLTQQNLGQNQCVDFQQYLAFLQTPTDNYFYQDMTDLSKRPFNEKDWDYEELSKELRGFSASDYESGRLSEDQLKKFARLEYLERQPSIKSLFQSKDKKALPKKIEFFEILKLYSPQDQSCYQKPGACFEQFSRTNAQRVKEKTREFLINKDVQKIIKKSFNDSMTKLVPLLSSDLNQEKISLIDNNPKNDLQLINQSLSCASGKKINCQSEIINTCNSYTSRRTLDLIEELQHRISKDFQKDENDGYENANKIVCESKFYSANGEGKTFLEYSKEWCSHARNKNDCLPENKQNLLNKFLCVYFLPPKDDKNFEYKKNLIQGYLNIANQYVSSDLSEQDLVRIQKSRWSGEDGLDLSRENEISELRSKQFSSQENDDLNQTSQSQASQSTNNQISSSNEVSSERPKDSAVESEAATILPPALSSMSAADLQQAVDKTKEEKVAASAELDQMRSSASILPKSDPSKAVLEDRIKSLEKLVAQKESDGAQYQKLLDQMSGSGATAPAEKKRSDDKTSETSNVKTTPSENKPDSVVRNATNFVPYAPSTQSFGSSSFSSASRSAEAKSARQMNQLLLSKYQTSLPENAPFSSGGVLIANEKDSRSLASLESRSTKIPLEVTSEDYVGIENNNPETLKKLESTISKFSGSVVKLQITSKNMPNLEIIAIKESGKIIWQPIRKAKLETLRNILPKS
ncbi:MAG: hypothetical protein AB7I27_19550 [Bacteriovoracaceae bacterium]